MVNTNEINFVDGDGAAIAKVAASRFLKVVSKGIECEAIVKPGEMLSEDALALPCGGGTSIDHAVDWGLQIIEKHPGRIQEADLVLITDGGSEPELATELRSRASKLGASVLGIGIGVPRQNLEPWCDVIETITSLDTVDDGAANALFAERT